VKARNPASHPVIVTTTALATGPSGTFYFHLRGPSAGISGEQPAFDPSQTTFAPGETKWHVFDFVIGKDLFLERGSTRDVSSSWRLCRPLGHRFVLFRWSLVG